MVRKYGSLYYLLFFFLSKAFIYLLFFKFIYLFIFGCIGSSLPCMGFLQLRRAGAALPCGAQASHCGSFSCCGAQALGAWASVVVARRLSGCGSWALECRLSSYGSRDQLLHSMWDLPGPELEPVSPALAGGFLNTVPPRKSLFTFICLKVFVRKNFKVTEQIHGNSLLSTGKFETPVNVACGALQQSVPNAFRFISSHAHFRLQLH